jgi:hypothetical protein
MIPVDFQYRESVLLILEEMIKNMWPFDAPGSILEVFHFPPVISYSIPLLSHLTVLLPTVLSIYPIMSSSSSKSGFVKQLSDNPQPHVFKTFHFNGDYEAFRKQVILPLIHDSMTINMFTILTNPPFHFWYHLLLPDPQLSQFTNSFWTLISIHQIVHIPFPHYINYPPHQSASILITWRLTTQGFFSLNIPGCFISDDEVAYLKGNIVALGPDTHQKVVIEGVMEVGRYFILYEVQEVGSIPIGCVQTIQLVTPLNLHLSVLLSFLALMLIAFFPCFFCSSAIFWKLGKVLKEEGPSRSWFSNSTSMA